jgi:tetratricopeptide (TPR) repeat protein
MLIKPKYNINTFLTLRFTSICIFLWAFLLPALVFAQPKWRLDLDGKVEENGKKLEGANVKILKNGTEVANLFTSSAGAFKYSLEPNADYMVKVTKPGGYVTKLISISTKNVPSSEDDGSFVPYKLEVTLFKELPGLDVSALKDPVGKVFYIQAKNDFGYDEAYTKAIRAKMEQLIMDLEKQLELQAKKKIEFDKLMVQGDAAAAAKKFDNALTAYNEALALKIDDEKVKPKIEALEKARAAEEGKAKSAEFEKILKQGDEKLTGKKYDEAITFYNQALALHVNDEKANAKIKAAQDAKKAEEDAQKQNAEKEKQKAEYEKLIKQGDELLKNKKFDEAVASYTQALSLKFNDTEANARISAAQKAKADEDALKNKEEQAKKKAEFDKIIKQGDDLLKAKKFDEAVTVFNQALAMKFDDPTANARIAAAQKAKADEEALKNKEEADKKRAEFDKIIKQGDDLLKGKKFDEAVGIYTQALNLKVDDNAANAKIAEAQKAKADAEAEKNKEEKAKKKAEFDKLIAAGDEKLAAKKFDDAITSFTSALAVKFDDNTANARIKAAQDAKQAELDAAKSKEEEEKRKAEYAALIKQGDAMLKEKKYDDAIGVYTQALNLKVKDTEVETNAKIVAAQKAKADAEAEKNKAEQEKRKAEFEAFLKQGDALLKDKKYDEAVGVYTQALNMNLENDRANAKISEAQKAKADAESAKNQEEQAKKKAEFDKLIATGDEKLAAKKFDDAITSFTSALAVKFDDNTANARIKTAQDAKQAEMDAAKSKEEEEKRKAEYAALIKQGDAMLKEKKYDDAIGVYTQALNLKLKDTEVEANAKIVAAQKAKADAEAEKNKAEQEKRKAEFEAFLKQGDALLKDKKYDEAVGVYTQALNMNLENDRANAKISEAQKAKADADAEKNKAEEEKRKAEFEAFIKQGDGLLKDKKYDEAVGVYTQALNMNLENDKANAKIAEAQKAKADAEAAKNQEEEAKKKAEFDKLIAAGDEKLAAKKYDEAITSFNAALAVKYDDTTANARIKAAQDAKQAEEDAQKNKAEAEKKEAEFKEFIKQGNALLKEKKFDEAIAAYTSALNLGIHNEEANAKIAEAQKAKADADAEKNKAEEEKRKAEFEAFMKQGDGLLKDKKYDEAVGVYTQALNMNLENDKANAKIAEAQKAKADAEAAKNQEEEAKKKAEFDKLIAAGDEKLAAKKFDEAITSFNAALAVKYDDTTANARIKAAQDAKQAEEDAQKNKAEAEKKEAEFKEFIKQGNALLKEKKFDEAIAAYTSALNLGIHNEEANAKIAEAQKAKADADAEKNKAEEEKRKAEFEAFMKQGDGLLKDKKYDEAVGVYTQALNMNLENDKANVKIAEAQKAKADAEAAKNQEEEARKKAEFEKFIAAGDEKLAAKKFDDAIAAYNSALAVKFDDNTANAKIKTAQEAKQIFEDSEKSKAEKAKKEAEFQQFLKQGDGLLKEKKFDDAISVYNQALNLGINNELANTKIAEAQKSKTDDENARSLAEKEKLIKEFNEFISSGEKQLKLDNFDLALEKFNAALVLKVDDNLANQKIADLEKKRADYLAKKKAEEEAKNKADFERREKEFKKLIASGDNDLSFKKFDNAGLFYSQALELNVDNSLAEKKMDELRKARAAEEDRLKAELEAKEKADREAREKAEQERKKREFDRFMLNGKGSMGLRDFNAAIEAYQSALDLGVDNTLADQALKEAKSAKEAADLEKRKKQFAVFIGEGSTFHKLKSYQLAVDKFQAALDLNIDNPLASQLLEKSQKALNAQRLAEEKSRAAMDDVARKKAEAEAREREFLEKKRRAEEEAKTVLVARLEEQKNALSQAQRFKEEREKNKLKATPNKEEALSRMELAKKYGQGTTTEEIDGPNCVITRIIIVKGDYGDEFKKVKYNYGQVVYFKNRSPISDTMFDAFTGVK